MFGTCELPDAYESNPPSRCDSQPHHVDLLPIPPFDLPMFRAFVEWRMFDNAVWDDWMDFLSDDSRLGTGLGLGFIGQHWRLEQFRRPGQLTRLEYASTDRIYEQYGEAFIALHPEEWTQFTGGYQITAPAPTPSAVRT